MDENILKRWYKSGFEYVVKCVKTDKNIYRPFTTLESSIKEATYQENVGNKFKIFVIEELLKSKK
jgi:hypothetical protein